MIYGILMEPEGKPTFHKRVGRSGQAYCWPVAGGGRDVVGIAKTGSGKTLAAGRVWRLLVTESSPFRG